MRVWLITTGEPIPTDSKTARLMRTGILAQFLVDAGHEVCWWTTSFYHSGKRQRCEADTEINLETNYRLQLIHTPGYGKNISWQRIRDHRMAAAGFRRLAAKHTPPDVVLCSLPTVELSQAAVEYGQAHKVPVVLDTRDMWPDIFTRLAPAWCSELAKIALAPMERACRKACSGAFAITGHTPGFVEWGLKKAGRCAGPFDRDFPFGYVESIPSIAERRNAADFWDNLGLVGGIQQPLVCFFGSIGKQFRMDVVIQAARILQSHHPEIAVKFVLCGAGEGLEACRQMGSDCDNIVFPGWVEYPHIWELMRRSQVAIAPYQDTSDFQLSIPNKAIEYLSGGLPILTSLSRGILCDLLARYDCGLSYANHSDRLAEQLCEILGEKARQEWMGENARQLYTQRFTARQVYTDMTEYLIEIAEAAKSEPTNIIGNSRLARA